MTRSSPQSPPVATPSDEESARLRGGFWLLLLPALWTFLVQAAFLAGDVLATGPASAFFFGDSLHYLSASRDLALGTGGDAGLPFHPPMITWLLTPIWGLASALELPETQVFLASKILMTACNAASASLLLLLLRRHLAPERRFAALPVCLLLPLGFGEMQLSAVVNSESVYRLLLLLLLTLGARLPWLAGLLHGAAALTRAEHLPVALAVGLVVAWRVPALRRTLIWTLVAAGCVLAPYTAAVSGDLRDYNREFAAELPEPLPTIVPVSFYGPLNFALAHREDEIFFSRRTLPITRGEAAGLDPLDPVHNEAIVHGYRLGLKTIFESPGRFLRRTGEKLLFSVRAFTHGWIWRDAPGPGTWTRQPVDLSSADASTSRRIYQALIALCFFLGAMRLRDQRALLVVGFGLIGYRLAMNAAFFPYLRGMSIAWPFALLCIVVGAAALFQKLQPKSRRGALPLGNRRAAAGLFLLIAGWHLATAWQTRRYGIDGERSVDGRIFDDRPVVLIYRGSGDDS